MLDINNMYQLTVFTSGFVFFAVLFFNGFRFVNWLNMLRFTWFIDQKNIKESKFAKATERKKLESDCESPVDSDKDADQTVKPNRGIKKVSYSPETNFEHKKS